MQTGASHAADQGWRILVVDGHPVIVAGLRHVLRDSGPHRIDHTPSFAEAFRRCRQHRPTVVVVEIAQGVRGLAGLSFVRRLRSSGLAVPIFVLSMHSDPLIAREALKLGANGYVPKDVPAEEIAQGLATVVSGTSYVSRALASDLAFLAAREPERGQIDSLSPRERHVLSLLADGKSYIQIAANLAISYKSVAHICNRLKPKLGVQSLPELVRFAMRHFPAARSMLQPPVNRKPRAR